MSKYYWGADPASVNMGVCILDEHGRVVLSKVVNPKEMGVSKALDSLPLEEYPPSAIVIERFVSYRGAQSSASELTLMVIGALMDRTRDAKQLFFRAIDWKMALTKKAAKESGFVNPSTSLDKKLSKALATHLTGVKFKTDHEADAACLAYIGTLRDGL